MEGINLKMNEKIRIYVNDLLKNAPSTKKVNDMKDEIISNAIDKYNDLVAEGKSEKEAYEKVTAEIGNVDEIVSELAKENPITREYYEKSRSKTAFIVSISVAMYILSLIACIVLDEFNMPDFIIASSFFTLAGIPTCLLIYHFMSRPKYTKYEETMVEDFKEWKDQKDSNKEIKKAISSIVWTLTVIVYLLISFSFGIWYISWIIFLIAALIENIINLLFKLGEMK